MDQEIENKLKHPRRQRKLLVIGGGIAGITAAVEAAETGCEVILVEKQAFLGGQVAGMNEYFPKLCPPSCGLEINYKRIRNNPCIEVLTSTTLAALEGVKGNYSARLLGSPEYVNQDCTACGECSAVCPVTHPDPFNYGATERKAIALPHPYAFPPEYQIDPAHCIGETCGKCVDACKYNAINLKAEKQYRDIAADVVIIATGWTGYDPENLTEYSWGKSENILTNLMFERLGSPTGPTAGKILRPSDKQPARRIAFVQCVGSRDENHLPYCSAVCCSASMKQAMYFAGENKENRADIYYIDLRISGRNEDFLQKVEENEQIALIKGKVSAVSLRGESPVIEAEDIMQGRKIKKEYDLVVLATGICPTIPEIKNLVCDDDGFIIKDSLDTGLAAGGCCCEPKDVAASVMEATGLVINALQV